MERTTRRVLTFVFGLVALQAIAWTLFRSVETARRRSDARGFAFETIEPPRAAPSLSFEDNAGRLVALSSYRGRPVLLHFWATWCAPCRAELPSLLARSRAGAASGPAVLLVSLDENWDVIRHFFGGAVPPEVVTDASRSGRREYHVDVLPQTVVLRASGHAVARVRGARDWQSGEAGDVIARLTGAAR